MDWGVGEYERTAAQLVPAAEALIAATAPRPGERVADIGCGTGNAALLAAELGAEVIGVDPAARLVEVASQRAEAASLDARFVVGSAESIPLDDCSVDLVTSVFGVIFAADAEAAIGEMTRITTPDGRVAYTAWTLEGALSEVASMARAAISAAVGAPNQRGFAWHEPDAVQTAFAQHGFSVEFEPREIAFTAESPEAYVNGEFENHPLWLVGRSVLEPRGESEAVRRRAVEIFTQANEDPAAFRVTSRYVIVTASRE